jgi:hypothetical protein
MDDLLKIGTSIHAWRIKVKGLCQFKEIHISQIAFGVLFLLLKLPPLRKRLTIDCLITIKDCKE